jgi:iron complex outermembrane receptor protein
MQSVLKQQPKLRLSLIAVACHLACLGVAHAQTVQAQSEADAGQTRSVVITGQKTNMGLMVQEDAPKARSTITAAELERQRPTGNAYQALELMPSVNSYNYDATGLFGGGLTLRGFNSDQIGATINGVPVNDSGSFAVYPQEYVDQENTCSEFVTQGSTDVDSPQVGASGGNFGIITCNPEDNRRIRYMQTLGQLNMYKSFVRYDTGKLWDPRAKAFISLSHAKTDKWKGDGTANRTHVDAGFNWDWDRFNYVHATMLWNDAHTNNIYNLSRSQLNQFGYYYDYSSTFPGHLKPVRGTAQNETTIAPNPQYYQLANNPFKNAIASATAKFRLADNLDLKVVPYYWYGFGTGGTQQQVFAENAFLVNRPVNGVYPVNGTVDLNGDGDTLDRVIVAESSVTRTGRPGITTSLTYSFGANTILGGFWWERAHHEQTAPGVPVDNQGRIADTFLQDYQIHRADGSLYQFRNWSTVSTAYQGFIQDTLSLMDDRLTLNFGVRTPHIKRDFNNYANETTPINYGVSRTYSSVLPQFGIRFKLTDDDQLYASIAKNFKAPGNFVYATTNGNVSYNKTTGVVSVLSDVRPEVSYSLDAGIRHQTKAWNGTFDIYGTDFRDRMATAYDPLALVSSTTNVGKVKNYGFEVEAGNTPINGWSAYVSYGYNHSEIKSNLQNGSTAFLPTAGKVFPLTPKNKFGLSLMYQTGAAWARLSAKSTSRQAATLTNDEWAPGYTTFGLDGGYTFPDQDMGYLKNPKLTFNVSNLTSKQFLNPSSQSVTNATAYGTINTPNYVSPKNVFYYLGAPRFVSATLSVDF